MPTVIAAPLPFFSDNREEKFALRRVLRTVRGDVVRSVGAALARDLVGHGCRAFLPLFSGSPVVAGYWPRPDEELDPRPVLEALRDEGWTIALPVVVGADAPLVFRRYDSDDALVSGAFGLLHPPESASQVHPCLVLVPLLGFDATGQRLGYGGGYYDRTLAALRMQAKTSRHAPPLAVGIALDQQRVQRLPSTPFDQPLDGVLTPSGLTWFHPPS